MSRKMLMVMLEDGLALSNFPNRSGSKRNSVISRHFNDPLGQNNTN
jgi:hypothetical protein